MRRTHSKDTVIYYLSNYFVTVEGNILHKKKNKKLKEEITKNGYARVTLSHKGTTKRFLVHRLVAFKYLDDFSFALEINHKNGDKLNNHANNLECTTSSKNIQHAYDTGLKKKKCKLSKNDWEDILEKLAKGESKHSISRKYAIDRGTIKYRLKHIERFK